MSSETSANQNGWIQAPTYHVETSAHAEGVERLYDRVFGPGRFARTAERLREGNSLLLDCSRVVMDEGGDIVAAVRLWPLAVGGEVSAVFVGPVAVDKTFRGGALGLEMTNVCLQSAKEQGFSHAVLIGDAPYFGKIGFVPCKSSDYPAPGHIPEGRLLMRTLLPEGELPTPGALSVPRGATSAS